MISSPKNKLKSQNQYRVDIRMDPFSFKNDIQNDQRTDNYTMF